jgi:cardiolipin synthase
LNIPNLLTLGRILFIIPILYFFEIGNYKIGILLLILAMLTDFFDGYLARKLNQTTKIGAILDPIADKLILLILFGYLILSNVSPLWYFLILCARNILQLSAIPILVLWKKIDFKVQPKLIPKLATTLAFIILFYFLFDFVVSKDSAFAKAYSFTSHSITQLLIFLLLVVSTLLEVFILVTFIPRFIQIYLRKHDTFE